MNEEEKGEASARLRWVEGEGGGGAHGEGGLLLAYLPNDAADLLGGEQKQQLGSA